MTYKEKINEILKGIGFEEKGERLVNFDGLCEVESSFDENGHWQLCVTVRQYRTIDCTLLENANAYGLVDEMFVAKVFHDIRNSCEEDEGL